MYLIDENNDPVSVDTAAIGLLHDCTNILDPTRHRRKGNEFCFGLRCNNLRKCSFTNSRRPPKNHGGDMVTFDKAAEHLSTPQEMFLPDKLFERLRANTFC